MPEPAEPPTNLKPKRAWFRRGLKWVGVTLLVLVIFHRPLFHFTVRIALRAVAARMHVAADLHTSGSIFTNLTVEDVQVRAEGDKTPIRLIEIKQVRLEYSLPKLVRNGVGEFLRSYEIHHAHLELVALPSKDKQERHEKVAIAKMLNDILGQPAAYSDRVWIDDFNITVTAPSNVTEVKGFNLRLDPEKAGSLQIDRLAIPGVPAWEFLSAETSYAERNFFIKDLRLAPEIVLDEVNFDASQRAQNKGSVKLRAHVFGGTAALDLSGSQLKKGGEKLDKSYDTTLKVELANVGIDRAAAYFHAPAPPVSRLAQLSILFTGEPEKPRTWRGSLAARVEAIAAGALKIDAAGLNAAFNDGRADITAGDVAAGQNHVTFGARIGLPESVNDFPRSDVEAALKIAAPDLPTLTATMPAPLTGAVNGGGTIVLRAGQLRAEIALDAQDIANKDLGLTSGKVTLQANKQVDPPTPGPFDGLDGRLTADLGALRFQTVTLDSARVDVEARHRFIKLQAAEVRRGENFVSAEGSARIPEDAKLIAKTPVDAQFTIHVPQLGDFGIATKDETLTGQIEGSGALKLTDGALAGGLQIDGRAFKLGGFIAERLAAKIAVANNEAVIDELALQLNGTDRIVATGKAGIAKPFAYEGALLVDIKSLASLQPLLELFGNKQPLAGTLAVQWNGKGQVEPQGHHGQLDLALTKAKFGSTEISELELGGLYTPEFAESKPFRIVAGPTSLGGAIEYRDAKLRLKDLKFEQAGTSVLTGYVYVPFDPANTKQPIAFDQRIAANINTDKLDVEKLLASFGQPSPVSGAFNANLVAGGTLLQPFAHLKVAAERLQAKAAKQFEPGTLALDLHYSNKELTLAATVKQPQMQPLTIKARTPLDLQATVENKKLDPDLPIEATAQLPPSALGFLTKIAPAVRRIDGTAALDVKVAGTVTKPVFSGGADVELKGARMADENIPAIGVFRAKLGFAENKLNFQTFEGEVGGGKFKLGGSMNLADLKNPVFGLRLESNEVLVKRDDSITIRADADVKLDGPLNAAAVTGALYVVRSRFFREIDILPIALPGKPKPAPKVAQRGPTTVSFPQPPLRDWKFDLAIKTKENDPFLIRGNLANGAVSLNLKLGGTGLAPYLEGTAKIDQFVATLPFSKLAITSGFLAFTKDLPFQPSMELQAESHVRDYLVHAFIYGKATDPQVQLNSEPPLPHADIVSLLATGTTTSELAGSADALASRAALLAVKQLYQKIFKRGAAPPPDDPKKTDSGSLLDRFDVELGALSNRSSGQDIKARFKVTDQVYLLGDIGVDGNFTGSLKYLIRFR
ncbi:MAG: translocation/assembly module TamB domain-containing protein [Chthoniobacteraceae bacterium]